jgi:hypothetical protein
MVVALPLGRHLKYRRSPLQMGQKRAGGNVENEHQFYVRCAWIHLRISHVSELRLNAIPMFRRDWRD